MAPLATEAIPCLKRFLRNISQQAFHFRFHHCLRIHKPKILFFLENVRCRIFIHGFPFLIRPFCFLIQLLSLLLSRSVCNCFAEKQALIYLKYSMFLFYPSPSLSLIWYVSTSELEQFVRYLRRPSKWFPCVFPELLLRLVLAADMK